MDPRTGLPAGFDAYKTLQVDPEADPDVIQAAYRRLAQKFHPDRTTVPGGEARMVAINAAWEILRDPDRRAAYDRTRRMPRSVAASGPASWSAAAEPSTSADGSAGPPPGRPSGAILTFGRYAGWSLGEIVRVDPGYLEWLDRAPVGRAHRAEIDALLRAAGLRGGHAADRRPRGGLFRRR